MASLNIHLAIGKRYIEKNNNINNIAEFYKGTLAPDLVQNKIESHYTSCLDKSNLEYYLSKKVELYDYLTDNKEENDYETGVFLHLITDYLFFNTFFDEKYIKGIDINTFNNDLYHSYDNTDKYIEEKYNLELTDIFEEMNSNKEKNRKEKNTLYNNGKDIIPIDKLDIFIENISNIDINNYRNKILKYKRNILP